MNAGLFDWQGALDECRGCVCFQIKRAVRALVAAYDDALRPSGLRSTQFSTLGVIRAYGPLTAKKLGEVMLIDKTTLARNLALLAREGLIRTSEGRDRREKLVSLTPIGAARFQQAFPLWRKMQQRVLRRAGASTVEGMRRDLAAVVAAASIGGPHGKEDLSGM